MIKTYELINGTLKEVAHSDEPKVELKWFLDGQFKRHKPSSPPINFNKISLIAKKYSHDGLDLILAKDDSYTLLYLGTYSEPKELKEIEAKYIISGTEMSKVLTSGLFNHGDYTMTLIAKNYSYNLDLFIKQENGDTTAYLGHWNDGIVK